MITRDWYIVYNTTSGEIRASANGDSANIEPWQLPALKSAIPSSESRKITTEMMTLDPGLLNPDDTQLPNIPEPSKLWYYARLDVNTDTLVWCNSRYRLTVDGVEKSVDKVQADNSVVITIQKTDYDDVDDTTATDTVDLETNLGTLSASSVNLVNGQATVTLTFPASQTLPYAMHVRAYNLSDFNVGVGVIGVSIRS